MAKNPSALAGIFDDESDAVENPPVEAEQTSGQGPSRARSSSRKEAAPVPRRSSHPGKKSVLIHIPEDMHRTLRQLSVEEGGEPLTVVTERLLRQYLVKRGHARFAP